MDFIVRTSADDGVSQLCRTGCGRLKAFYFALKSRGGISCFLAPVAP